MEATKANRYGHAITKIHVTYKDIYNLEDRYTFDACSDEGQIVMNGVDEARKLACEREKRKQEKCEFQQYLRLKEKYENKDKTSIDDELRDEECREKLKEKYPKGSYL